MGLRDSWDFDLVDIKYSCSGLRPSAWASTQLIYLRAATNLSFSSPWVPCNLHAGLLESSTGTKDGGKKKSPFTIVTTSMVPRYMCAYSALDLRSLANPYVDLLLWIQNVISDKDVL